MSAFSVPNPKCPRKKTKSGTRFYTPEDEPNLVPGTHVLEDDGSVCMFKPANGSHEMEDDSVIWVSDGIIVAAPPQGE